MERILTRSLYARNLSDGVLHFFCEIERILTPSEIALTSPIQCLLGQIYPLYYDDEQAKSRIICFLPNEYD